MNWEPKIKLKNISIAVTCTYIVLLIPLFIMSFYNYPSGDDFAMGYRVHCAFQESGSVLYAFWMAIYMAWYYYFNWVGYFSSSFLMCIPPSVFDERIYFIWVFILLAVMTFGYIYFFRVVFVKILKRDKTLVHIITMLTLILTVECLPMGLARAEGIFWYCGAANYTLLYILGMIFVGLMLSATVDRGGKLVRDLVLASLLGFFIGGGNYLSALSVALFSVLFAVWVFIKKKDKRLLIPIVINLIGFLLSCIAPGNSVRGGSVEGFGAVKTILICIYYVLDYCVDQWTTWAVLLLLLISLPFIWKLTENCSLSFKYPVPVIFFAYTFTAANIAPPVYTLGNITAGRLQILFFMQYILLLVLVIFYMMGWIRIHLTPVINSVKEKDTDYLSGPWAKVLVVSTALFLFLAAINSKPVPEFFTTGSAITDLVNGHAAYYKQQNMERRQLLLDENSTDVVLDYFEYEPELLFYMDITPSPDDWINQSISKYYNKNSVVRTERESKEE